METGLQCLLLSSDDKTVRVLRRVLSEIDVDVEHCSEADAALQKITRRRFEGIIVDCSSAQISSAVLKCARSAPANKRAVTVAVLEDQSASSSQTALKRAFEMGAHFVLCKPISLERTRASFRAVRALMKRERRRHARIPINFPVEVQLEGNNGLAVHTVDLGENGMAVKLSNRKLPASFLWKFTLPGTSQAIAGRGEIAWEGDQVAGIRFCDLDSEVAAQLKTWVERQLTGAGPEEVSVSSKLTDLSLNACYLETESPFPVRTRLQLVMKVGQLALEVEGLVRVMHPGTGMGLEFTQNTAVQRVKVEEFIQALINSAGAVPDLQVRPDAIENSAVAISSWEVAADEADPLLSLFHSKAEAPAEVFYSELRKQRGALAKTGVGA